MVSKATTELQMNQEQIEKYARRFLSTAYKLGLCIPIVINPRLSSTLGQFLYNKTNNRPVRLEFSKKYLINGNLNDIKKMIKHECIHYAMFIMNKPFNDGDPYFEAELKKHNSISTDIINFPVERNVRVYTCDCREHIYLTTITAKYCTTCNQRLAYIERRKQLV